CSECLAIPIRPAPSARIVFLTGILKSSGLHFCLFVKSAAASFPYARSRGPGGRIAFAARFVSAATSLNYHAVIAMSIDFLKLSRTRYDAAEVLRRR
ncbi:hypothetical protein, partial [Lachnoclostridium sp. Marseille-P6806]|uniref:hypothetical protein n=1 Tax=Lachnoclostridium sp. Marseille-P6806 TaxID=2364793 RepID=UPI001A9348B4